MSRLVSVTVDTLLARVRQTGAGGTSNDLATQILSKCQRIVNAGLRRVIASSSFSTTANVLVYAYRSTLTAAVDILSIKEGNRELTKCNALSDFAAYDKDWFTKTGTRFEAWLQLGRDLLILYPAKTSGSSVTVVYSKLTTEYTSYAAVVAGSTNMDLPDDDVDLAVGLAEVILLIRGKQPAVAQRRAETLMKELAITIGYVT